MSRSATLPPITERVAVRGRADVAVATSLAVRVATASGVARPALDAVRIVASELAENLHRHAEGGELAAVPPWPGVGSGQFALCALDRGPGVEHFDRCLIDGYSTGGTMGTGLGAARRMSDDFAAVSEPGVGTVVRAAFDAGTTGRADPHFVLGAFGVPVGDQLANGDAFAVARRGSRVIVLLSDGLGHGPDAAEASAAAIREFGALTTSPPATIVAEISRRIVATRGAAVTVASLDLDVARHGGRLQSAGLGNVAVLVAEPGGATRRIVTSHGTAGVRSRSRVTEQQTAFTANGLLVLHSDGVSARWTFDGRGELLRHPPDLVAAALWRDHGRDSDDSLVVVVRARPRTSAS